MAISGTQQAVYEMLTGEDDGRVCRDIPESACHAQPRNFIIHVLCLGATKTGDGLADPKLVLSWLLTSLGAPAYLLGLLVPLREAGALLPQLFIAARIRAMPQRKWAWAAGSLIQGACVAGMALAAFTLDGLAAGWAFVVLLTIFACARSVCSVSYKDVLGKTVSKSTRGTATGTAGTIAAALVFVFGVLLSVGVLSKAVATIASVLLLAAGLWIVAALLFTRLAEDAGATEGGGNPVSVVLGQLSLLREDPQLRRFITTRALLIPTALAPPYLLSLSGQGMEGGLGRLGPFVVASSLAAVGSSYLWGRLSDRSSRKVLMLAGIVAATDLSATAVLAWLAPTSLQGAYLLPCLLFLLMIAYQGVRLGRATHIVDMADRDKRAAYTALSNSIIGILLLGGGLFGLLAEFAGTSWVLVFFAMLSLLAAWVAVGLQEVQQN